MILLTIEEKAAKLGYSITEPPEETLGNFVAVRRSGNRLYTAGFGAIIDGKPLYQGRVGREVSLEEAAEAARITAALLLRALRAEIGDLSKIKLVKVLGFVNSSEDFFDQPLVINGASDFFVEVLGENGKHARSSVGVYALPMNIPVEIELIAEIIE